MMVSLKIGKSMQKVIVDAFANPQGINSMDIQILLDCSRQTQHRLCKRLVEYGILYKTEKKDKQGLWINHYDLTTKGREVCLDKKEMSIPAITLCNERNVPIRVEAFNFIEKEFLGIADNLGKIKLELKRKTGDRDE